MVKTFAPPILVNWGTGGRAQGYGAASIWKQRAHRWTVSALRITGLYLWACFCEFDFKIASIFSLCRQELVLIFHL